jgi:preprotein translocase subunit SecE
LGVQVPPALLQEVTLQYVRQKILKVKKVPAKKGKTVSVNSTERLGLFGRMSLFLRQVMFELKKVVWPTKEQLVTYTAVVVVFVIIMGLIIAALDFAFVKLVLLVFG